MYKKQNQPQIINSSAMKSKLLFNILMLIFLINNKQLLIKIVILYLIYYINNAYNLWKMHFNDFFVCSFKNNNYVCSSYDDIDFIKPTSINVRTHDYEKTVLHEKIFILFQDFFDSDVFLLLFLRVRPNYCFQWEFYNFSRIYLYYGGGCHWEQFDMEPGKKRSRFWRQNK